MKDDLVPMVSVVIPVYNGETFISQSIESVLAQNYQNFEVIVVDDGSTDNTKEIVLEFGNRVNYYLQENAGSAVARNLGITHAKGDYIAFNDGDDLWLPNRLNQQVDFLETHDDYGVACGRFQHVDENFQLSEAIPVDDSIAVKIDETRSGWVYHTLFECSWYHIIAALVRKEVFENVRFEPDYRRGQDYDFWLQLAHYTKIAQLDVCYAYYRKNLSSISHKPHLRNYRAEIITNSIKKFGKASQDGQCLSDKQFEKIFYKLWFEYGYELFLYGWYKRALVSFKKAQRHCFLCFGTYKFIFRCLLNLHNDKSSIE